MEYTLKEVYTILSVPSIEATIAWYEDTLGWQGHMDVIDDEGLCLFGSVLMGDYQVKFTGFNLSRANPPPCDPGASGFTALIYVDNVDAVYARAVAHGATTEGAPQDRVWGERNFALRDLNSYRLVFSQEIESIDLEEIRRRLKDKESDKGAGAA